MSRQNFWRDIATISSASVFSQIIIFVTTPIFTRLYEPAAFGIAAIFMAIIFTIFPVSSFSYNHAIVIAEEEDEATSVAILSFLLTLAVSFVLLIPFVAFHETLFPTIIAPELRNFLWLIPASVFVKGTCSILLMESTREKSFGAQGQSKVIQTVTERILVIGAGLLGKAEALAIIIGRLISYFFEAVPFSRIVGRTVADSRALSWHSLKNVAIKYRQFPLFANWTFILANLSAYVSIFLIAFYFPAEFTGLYVMSERVVFTPLMVFGDSLKSVYYQKAATQYHDPIQLRNFYLRLRERMLAYGIFPALLLLFFGREIFRIFLGANWEAAGGIAGVIGLFAFFQFVSSPVMGLVNVLGKQKPFLYFTGLLFSVRCLSFIIGGLNGQPMMAVWLLAVSGSLTYLAINGWIDSLLSINNKIMIFQLLKYTTLSALLLFSILFIHSFYSSRLVLLLALNCVSLIYYSVSIRIVEGKTMTAFIRQMASTVHSR